MRTIISLLAASLMLSASAQILNPGDSFVLLAEFQADRVNQLGSVAWTQPPVSQGLQWIQLYGTGTDACLVMDDTGVVVKAMDDYVVPAGSIMTWSEYGSCPEDVWLRIVLCDQPQSAGDPATGIVVRSLRFGFAADQSSPLYIPEAAHMALFAAVGLLGLAAYRRFW